MISQPVTHAYFKCSTSSFLTTDCHTWYANNNISDVIYAVNVSFMSIFVTMHGINRNYDTLPRKHLYESTFYRAGYIVWSHIATEIPFSE